MKKHYKQYNAVIEPVSERKMAFTITTASVDRDNDTIDPKGWDLKNFMQNPVVLWAHDYTQPPVGKATNIEMTPDGLKADVEFMPPGMNPFADMVHDMCKQGFLNATSVGFAGKEFTKSKERDHGYDFSKQELLEFSIVPVPANPEALIQRGLKNDQLQTYAKAMRTWTKEILGDEAPKLNEEQFEDLASAIAKGMKEQNDEHALELPTLSAEQVEELCKQLVPRLKEELTIEKNQEVIIDIKDDSVELDIDMPEEKGLDPDEVAVFLTQALKDTMTESLGQLREMAGAQARAAINHMTGRLD